MPANFHQLIATEISAVKRFVALLKGEQEILENNLLDNLEHLLVEKNALINELTRLGEHRQAFMTQAGIIANRQGVESWLKQQQPPQLIQAWEELQSLAREAKKLNELNGQCIALLSRNNHQLLEIITNQQSRILYGPDGQTSGETGSRINDSV